MILRVAQDGPGTNQAADRWRPRLERLVEEHPDYLFAKAHLALSSVGAGDLERASEQVSFSRGKITLNPRIRQSVCISGQGVR